MNEFIDRFYVGFVIWFIGWMFTVSFIPHPVTDNALQDIALTIASLLVWPAFLGGYLGG